MPFQGDVLLRTREEIVAAWQEAFESRIPDVYWGEEGNLRMLSETYAGVVEGVFIAAEVVQEDMFVSTASPDALTRYGNDYEVLRKIGLKASGEVLFTGAGGTVIGEGAEIAFDPQTGIDPLYYLTTEEVTIPDPGFPDSPTLADGVAGALTGTYEYKITFVTDEGETIPGSESSPITVASKKINLSDISLGGPGTIARRIYRDKDGAGTYKFVHEISNNTTTTYVDNIADGSLGAIAPTRDTALRISTTAEAEDFGADYNVVAGSIVTLSDVPDGVTDVTNPAPFTGGEDEELWEDYRQRLLLAVRAPGTGSSSDIQSWAESVDGVESATVFPNTPGPGEITVRITGDGGSVPSSTLLAAVLAELESRDCADATFHVDSFTAQVTDVEVDVTLDTGYVLTDIAPSVEEAISDYINSLDAGETLYKSRLVSIVMALPTIVDAVVVDPATNLTTAAGYKRVPGDITVT